jgi:hypothetical protein
MAAQQGRDLMSQSGQCGREMVESPVGPLDQVALLWVALAEE